MHHDLDKILDNVRSKYYCSEIIARPTISWSEDFRTGLWGEYNLDTNHITVSRLFDNPEVTEEMLESIVYHESIHQEITGHNENFCEMMNRFPNYDEISDRIAEFLESRIYDIDRETNRNDFLKGKKKVVFVEVEIYDSNSPDFSNYFYMHDEKILVDCNVGPEKTIRSKDYFYIFLLRQEDCYAVIGWSTEGKLHRKLVTCKDSRFGNSDYSYQFETDRDHIYVINPYSRFPVFSDMLAHDFEKYGCCIMDAEDASISGVVTYINSYCEGYMVQGVDPDIVNRVAQITDPEKIDRMDHGMYQHIVIDNWLCKNQPSLENYMKRAEDKYNAWMLTAALENFIEINNAQENRFAIFRIIQIAVLTERYELGREYAEKYRHLLENNKVNRELLKALGL